MSGPGPNGRRANRRDDSARAHWLERDGVIDNFRRLVGESMRHPSGSAGSSVTPTCTRCWRASPGICRSPRMRNGRRWWKDAAALLARASDDGYLNTFVQAGLEERFGNLARGHEFYCAGHLIQAAVAYSRVTGDDCLSRRRAPVRRLSGEAFVGGRRTTPTGIRRSRRRSSSSTATPAGNEYLALAQSAHRRAGSRRAGAGPFGSDLLPGRRPGARAVQRTSGMRCARCTCSPVSSTSTWRPGRRHCSRRGASVGLDGGGEDLLDRRGRSRFEGEAFGDPYELPPDLIYGETCASIAAFMASWRLLLATGCREVRRPDGAHPLQRPRGVDLARARRVLLCESRCSAGELGPRRRRGQSPSDRRPGHARGVVRRRMLPAEHHAHHRIARRVPRDVDRRRGAAPAVPACRAGG